ncbi:hypothetical protein [Candidatus Amarobacter glycogenicus]|uniref:hypothetical protein n=1 Tax=Candidatus Amarobacter glycogenicus TaxID=3140699 RepID=UPI0031349AC2|nr:hypothetical protein [Dehalococcoidia bacterium]
MTLALTAVIEGDAVLHEGLWTRGHAQQVGAGRAWLGAQAPRAAVPPSVEREWRFPYEAGTEWVSVVRASGGQQAVDTVLRGRRITTAEILHPELFASGWKRADVALPDPGARPRFRVEARIRRLVRRVQPAQSPATPPAGPRLRHRLRRLGGRSLRCLPVGE